MKDGTLLFTTAIGVAAISPREMQINPEPPAVVIESVVADGESLDISNHGTVTVPAGTFDAYKVEIIAADNDADKQTVWIDKGSRKVLKISAVIPNLNGAVLTSELTR